MNAFVWHLIETKRFEDAILYSDKGIKLHPDNNLGYAYLAHSYLFTNKYYKAIKLYTDYLNRKAEDPTSLKSMLQSDFDFFQKNGFDKILVGKAMKDLKMN